MSDQATGGPAFPASSWTKDGDFLGDNQGMTLRDYFAAKAMQGWLSTFAESRHPADNGGAFDVAKASYALADAMLKEREK